MEEIVIVGAGVAGLACAHELARAGVGAVVLDKGRGVGGRCATRRVQGQGIDHGAAFLHGSDSGFLEAIDGVEGATQLEGWPLRVHGTGAPCQAGAFERTERRMAFAEGVSVFPKHLARGLDVRLGTRVEHLALEGEGFRLRVRNADAADSEKLEGDGFRLPVRKADTPGSEGLEGGDRPSASGAGAAGGRPAGCDARYQDVLGAAAEGGGRAHENASETQQWRARTVVLALSVEQAAALLETLPDPLPDGVRAARRLLGMVGSLPCLTVLAGYPLDDPAPPWDMCYPDDSGTLLLLSHDSVKRPAPRFRVLVLQAHARWSRQRLDAPKDAWTAELLEEAARIAGPWAARPSWTQAHVWRYARTDPGSELGAPILAAAGGGARIGFAGEVFGPGGGVEAAWHSGVRLARRVIQEDGA